MIKKILLGLEIFCLIAAVAFGILWLLEPKENFEPYVVLCSTVVVILDGVRRVMRSGKLRVFLSVGATYTKQQEEYVNAFERFLIDNGHERLVVGRDRPTSRQPIVQVRDLMKEADAVVVLAFTRYVIEKAIEKPCADQGEHKPKDLEQIRLPTVWNQIEAGLAFGLGRPILVIIEEGLKQEAMLKDRLEFRTLTHPLNPKLFKSDEFKALFEDFVTISRRRSLLRL